MKKNGIDVDECCYEEMSKGVGGQSIPSEYHNEPFRNAYENDRKGYKPDAWNWSGMRENK